MVKKKYGSQAGAKVANKIEAFKYGGGTPKKPVNDFFEKMKCGGLTKK